MRIIIFAAGLAFLYSVLNAQASYADWKDSLVRAIATPLMNRAVNYVFDRPSSNYRAPYAVPAPKKVARKNTSTPAKSNYSGAPTTSYLPPPPVIPGVVPSTTKSPDIPPPPKTMVPPPPPGVPTGAILGLYPQEFNVEPPAVLKPQPEKDEAPMPKLAPDFRKPTKKK